MMLVMGIALAGCGAQKAQQAATPANPDTQMFQSWRRDAKWDAMVSPKHGVIVMAADGSSQRLCGEQAVAAVREVAARLEIAECRRFESDAIACEAKQRQRSMYFDEDNGVWTVFGVTHVSPEKTSVEQRRAFDLLVENGVMCAEAPVTSSQR
jgi:hypothetical protein